MKKLTNEEIRSMWFSFFESKGHKKEDSASLIPVNDDSLLWINAGVTPLKMYFDGSVIPLSKRIVTIQKCIRTNDIENVGVTKRHQTFFEMMGNFSIGDYFKEDAIPYAFELLTSEEWFAIPKEKLYVTIYTDDEDAYNKWQEVGLDKSHIARLEGNFWEIGEGPCGPDSEIFFDRGENYDPEGDALKKFFEDEEQERYIEIWNNVFSQFNSKTGVERKDYKELPHKNIDTGAGFERWCCIFQGVDSTFDTDLFKPIIEAIEVLSGKTYQGEIAFKVIADHIRALTFALADGAIFENVGRGYVLRRLLRRSVRMGKKLSLNESFMYKLVDSVVMTMKKAYPYLTEKSGYVKALILDEENLFHTTLESGEKRLFELINASKNNTISGEEAFKLYDTYGFPFELTEEYLNELGFSVSRSDFDKYMEKQKVLAKSRRKQDETMSSQSEALMDYNKPSDFLYQTYELKSKITGIYKDDKLLKELDSDGYLMLRKTCFYATSGGQIYDTGMIIGKNFKARVVSVTKAPNGQHLHKIRLLDGKITLKDDCDLVLDYDRRKDIENNHSTVHILHYVLRELLNKNVHQAGSYVDNEILRLDFNYTGKLMDDVIVKLENRVNEIIEASLASITEEMSLEDAKKTGAMALFTEKYKDQVRLVRIGESLELCGGTHVSNTSSIKHFAIVSCGSIGSNIYRIQGATNTYIEEALFEAIKPYNDEMIKLLMKAKTILKQAETENIKLIFDIDINNDKPLSYADIIFNRNELEYIQSEVKTLEKKYFEAKKQKALDNLQYFFDKTEEINGINVIVVKTNNMDLKVLKEIVDNCLNQLKTGFVFVANVKNNDSIDFIARSNIGTNAGEIIKQAASLSKGNGGGSATFAQGGGKNTTNLEEIFKMVRDAIAL